MNKYNLFDLLNNELIIEADDEVLNISFDGVRIPMIQRDYAQGRSDENEVRERFLNAIFSSLKSRTALELDFVYGSVANFDDLKFFIPLDGQQRLTTLFLLYWYIGQREISDIIKLKTQQSKLSRFSYNTRATARKFCECLCNLGQIDHQKLPSTVIADFSWFYAAFEKDPTVKAMLHMLDDIHIQYNIDQKPIYDQLSLLTFYILPLDGFGLSDELYIKMNARGKQLTDFENFKADLINWMKDAQNKEAVLFKQPCTYNGRTMPYYMVISLKLDNDWTNFFWTFTKDSEKEENKLVDPLFLRFINRYLLNEFVLSSSLTQEALERSEEFKTLYSQDKKDMDIQYRHFTFYEPLLGNYATIKKIEALLDAFAKHFSEIIQLSAPSWDQTDRWHFFDPEMSQTQRILFQGICGYILHGPFDRQSFAAWMRVVWNIAINPDIRSVPAMVTATKLIADLSPNSGDIYSFLSREASLPLVTIYPYSELIEERQKAALITSDMRWEVALVEAEKHPLFQGSVGFLLIGTPNIDTFNNRTVLAAQLFGKNGPRNIYAREHVLMRATISKVGRFNDLLRIKMDDKDRNWVLLLRRNATVRNIISAFCSSESGIQMEQIVTEAISAISEIVWSDPTRKTRRVKYIHQQLYHDQGFHEWIQNRGAVDLVEHQGHYYVKKYRAWYDFVMLDPYRNELVSELISKYSLKTNNRCDQLNFYWGYTIDLQISAFKYVISLDLDQVNTLRAGIRKDKNYLETGSSPFNTIHENDRWFYLKTYDYDQLHSATAMLQLVDQIGYEIFELGNPDSLCSLLNGFL